MLFHPARIGFCILAGLVALGAGGPPLHAAGQVFTVPGVQVDVTAKDAMTARDQALGQAQQAAFKKLAEQLLSEEEAAAFTPPEVSVISPMVEDFEVTQEQLSAVRYIGTYTFRFKNAAVRNFFGAQGLTYTDVTRNPVLVLPFYQWGSRTVLWGQDNPFLAAWARNETNKGLVPTVIPIGDLQDVSDITDGDALTYDPAGLQAMLARYGADDAIVMLAAPVWSDESASSESRPDALSITLYQAGVAGPQMVDTIEVSAAQDEEPAMLFDRAVQAARKALQKDWKSRTLVNPAEANQLQTRVAFRNMAEWIETQKALRAVQGVTAVNLVSLKSNEAQIELHFQGGEDRLRLALAQADMTLTTPRVEFGNISSGYPQPDAAGSPLVYDLFLNRYAPGKTY
jgi:hypothetical protein